MDMILRTKAKKANGMNGDGYWYVVRAYAMPDGTPSFTISMDINKAKSFTKDEADTFNKLFMSIGVIDAPFEKMKGR